MNSRGRSKLKTIAQGIINSNDEFVEMDFGLDDSNINYKEDDIDFSGKYDKWKIINGNEYYPYGNAVTRKKAPSGLYKIGYNNSTGEFFMIKKDYKTDEYIDLPIKEFNEILDDIQMFWDRKTQFEKYGFLHKRGILLHGKQGIGKSVLLTKIVTNVIENDGIAFQISSENDLDLFSSFFSNRFQSIEKNRKVVVNIEDIDGLIKNKHNETLLLNLLDGIEHTNNIVYLATTNHIENLEQRITNRPSRFDGRYKIPLPDSNVRKVFIENKVTKEDLDKINVDLWVEKTDGFTIAHLKELIILVVIYGNTFDVALEKMKKLMEKPEPENYNDYGNGKRMGFLKG